MDEYEASCMRVEKISTAIQSIKESLTCRICLELFDEPVTIKCGHKFCRLCILRVTNNENSSCPFCNTKIQKRSIPKNGNALLQASVQHFEKLIKAIQADSGIDVSQPYNRIKNTKESSIDYSKPSTSKFEDTPSTSKGSNSIFNQKSAKPKVSNSVRSRLSLTKKKTDFKSPSQNSENNTLHKYYLTNKSDPVPNQIVHSQEKVQNWLDQCSSEDNDSTARNSIPGPSKCFIIDQLGTPPDEICCNPQNNDLKKHDRSPLPQCEESSSSKFKETEMKLREAEKMAKNRKLTLNVKENNNVKTPTSVPATSESDACNWRRVKQVGREMQVKTFKTLNVSIEKYSPSVAVDDTVIYNSTNNDSKIFSHGSEGNNISADKTPLQSQRCNPLKSENNNLPKKSPQIVIEDYKHQSLDSTTSPKQESMYVDENQLNEIIGVVPSKSATKTPEKTKTSLKGLIGTNLNSKLKQLSPSRCKSIEQELSNDESLKCDSRTTVVNLQNSPPKKNRLSLKSLKSTVTSKSPSPASILNQTNENEKELSNNFSNEKLNSKSLHRKTNSIEQKVTPIKSSMCDNLVNKRLSSVSTSCRILFQKLGKICKKSKNVPFRYLGRLEKEKCLYFNPCSKPTIVIKSNVPISIDYKSRMDEKNVANLEDFSSDESHSKIIASKNKVPLQLPNKSTVNRHEETMNIDEDINVQRPSHQTEQQMEIDETLPPAKMIVKTNSNFERRSSENQTEVEIVEDSSSKSSRTKKKSFGNENCEKLLPQTDENVPKSFRNTNEKNLSINSKCKVKRRDTVSKSPLKSPETDIGKWDLFPETSSNDTVKNSSNLKQTKSSAKKSLKKSYVNTIPDDMISISSDDSEAKVHRTNSKQKVGRTKFNESHRKSVQKVKVSLKSDVESCTESEVSDTSRKRSGKNNDVKNGYSSTSSSSLKTTGKKKRTHSESSNDDVDVVNIIDKWTKKAKTSLDSEKEQITKKPKILPDSEEMINQNASKVRHRSKFSLSSSDDEDRFMENKCQKNSFVVELAPIEKIQSIEVNVNNLIAMPSSMLSADLFETNEQPIQPMQSLKKQLSENSVEITPAIDFDAQSDKENISGRSPDNITVIDARQLKRKKSITSRNVDNIDKENSECNRTSDHNKSIKFTQETADEIESSQKKRKSTISKNLDNNDKEYNEQNRAPDFDKSIKIEENQADELESLQNIKNKTVDNFEHESDPCFVRESLLNITQEQIACKNIEKDLFGVDLSKTHKNQNEDPLNIDKFSTPRRKPTNSEENDEFDSDNIAPTPIAKRKPALRFPTSESSPVSRSNVSDMLSPAKKMGWIPAITPMKNTKSYPLCHSTPMMTTDSPENHIHSQIENIKLVCTSLTMENTKLVQKFADRFDAQFQSNFDMDVTHVIVKVDPQTKAGPKTFKYIQGIAFQKYVVSFEWITDCLAKNRLLDANNEKYDVLDPDIFESGCKKSRLSSQKLFKNFAFCCMEPFEKVSLGEFEELLTYNGAVIVSSLNEFHLYNNKLKVVIIGTEELNDEGLAILNKAEAAAVYFEWIVDSLSQFQILSLASYLFETTVEKVRSLGFPPELLVEEETLEEDEDDI